MGETLVRNDEKTWKKLLSMVDKIGIGMMTTADASGRLTSCPMDTAGSEADGTLWFFIRETIPPQHEIVGARAVCISYAEPAKQQYVSISGRAQLVKEHNKIKELWRDSLVTWFPEGQEDPSIALLRITVDSAEFWDAPSATMLNLYGWAKAKLNDWLEPDAEHVKLTSP